MFQLIQASSHNCIRDGYCYRIVGTFERENFHELVKNTIFTEKTFADCSLLLHQRTPHPKFHRKLSRIAHFCCTKGCHTPNFTEKTFANSHKTVKFAKVFFLESFQLCNISCTINCSAVLRSLVEMSWRYRLFLQLSHCNEWCNFVMTCCHNKIKISPSLK